MQGNKKSSYFKTKQLNLSNYLDSEKKTIRKKEKGCLFSITRRGYTTDLICLSLKSKWLPIYFTVIEGFRCLARLSLVLNLLK